jgi:8-oxo-dGTP diphosphatase
METQASIRVSCAGGIVFDADRRLLLIRRATPPSVGQWSVPGGRCKPDESSAAACMREVAEETGLTVAVIRHAGRVERPGVGREVFDIDDFVCAVTAGQLQAGDDASEARWVTRDELESLDLVPGLYEALNAWNTLPA